MNEISTDRALTLAGVSRTYRSSDSPAVEALRDIDLEVLRGEFVSIVGPSGCGKTTLLKVMAGLSPATSGEVWLGEKRVTQPLEDFGMMFQTPVLLPWRSALDNVLLPIEMLGRGRSEFRVKAGELLHAVGLSGFENRRPTQLSGGMQQRVALCRALIHDPAILLLDEPFGAVDELTREVLNMHLLTLWSGSKKTVVFVTHNVDEAVLMSDRVVVLSPRPGRVLADVTVPIPRPRSLEMRYDQAFVDTTRHIRSVLRQ